MILSHTTLQRYRLIHHYLQNHGFDFTDLLTYCREHLDASIDTEIIHKDLEDLKEHPEYGFFAAMTGKTLNRDSQDMDFIDFEDRPAVNSIKFLPRLIEAILNHQVLELYYQPFHEDKPFLVRLHPYLLKEYLSRWYLVGLNELKKELRTFALDRLIEIKTVKGQYIPAAFTAREYFKNAVGVISSFDEPQQVLVEVTKPQAYYLVTRTWHSSQYVYSEDEGKIVFSFRLHPSYEFISLILALGSDAKVLSPPSLIENMRKQVEEMMKNY